MKKNTLILAVLLAVLFCFTACGKGGSKPDTTAPAGNIGGDSGESVEHDKNETETGKMANAENPVVTITMENGGVITAELYPDVAPNTVNNFIYLINKGFYDGVIFHRVIPGFMIQGLGIGGPGYRISGEFTNNDFQNDLKHTRGVLSMARQGNPYNPKPYYDTAGSQFFIMVKDYPSLDNDYASFGKVIDGMDVVDAIVSVETDANDKPLQEQRIAKVTVDTKGVTYPEPVTLAE